MFLQDAASDVPLDGARRQQYGLSFSPSLNVSLSRSLIGVRDVMVARRHVLTAARTDRRCLAFRLDNGALHLVAT